MIIAIIGELGVGKTACSTYLAKQAFDKGIHVFSNYHLNFRHCAIHHPAFLVKIRDGLVVADELYNWASSLVSMSNLQKVLSHVYRKFRKKGLDLIYTTQRFKNVHIRLRSITDYIFAPRIVKETKRNMVFSVLPMTTEGSIKGKSFKFKLSEVKDLYDTNTDIYGFETADDDVYNYLIKFDVKEFHLGKVKT